MQAIFQKYLRKNVCKDLRCFFSSKALNDQNQDGKTVITEKVGEITTIGLNRPKKRNCIDSSSANSLLAALTSFENDETSKVCVIHGIGGNFCAGRDLEEINEQGIDALKDPEKLSTGFPHRILNKPVVAAVSGYAVAEGFELALMCDLRVLEENAVLGMYNRRFGIPCVNGGTVHLSAMIGLSRALDLILTGRTLTAEEAFQWGLANRLVACGTALGQAMQLAGSLVKFPQKCLLQDRENLYKSTFNHSLENLLQYERINSAKIINQESIEGAKKFIESGIGRHGKTYDLKVKKIPHWET